MAPKLALAALAAFLALPAVMPASAADAQYCHVTPSAPTCTFRCDGWGLGWYNVIIVFGDGTGSHIQATMSCGASMGSAFGSDMGPGMPAASEWPNLVAAEGTCTLVQGAYGTCGNGYKGSTVDYVLSLPQEPNVA